MKKRTVTYQVIFILLSLFGWPGGISSLWAQRPDSISNLPVNPDSIQADSSLTAKKQLIADSIQISATDFTPPIEAPVDTARFAQLSDSLLHEMRTLPKTFIPDPQRALWLSLVLPGAGQIYNRKYWKLPIVYGGFLGCIYALTWNNQMYRDYSQAYLDIMDDDPNTKSYEAMLPINYDITGREERFKVIFKNKKNYFRKYRDMSIFAFIGVYLLSVVDAYVDAELSSFDISKDLSLKVEPVLFNNQTEHPHKRKSSLGLHCKLNF